MTKTLLLLRHAKSSWKDASLADHDRPLNKRGERDAPRMGRLLGAAAPMPTIIVTSTAMRARNTAHAVVEASDFDGAVIEAEALYHASAGEITNVVQDIPDAHAVAMLVGHNPGFEDVITYLTRGYETMPTAALAVLELEVETWKEVGPAGGRLSRIWRPKELAEG